MKENSCGGKRVNEKKKQWEKRFQGKFWQCGKNVKEKLLKQEKKGRGKLLWEKAKEYFCSGKRATETHACLEDVEGLVLDVRALVPEQVHHHLQVFLVLDKSGSSRGRGGGGM